MQKRMGFKLPKLSEQHKNSILTQIAFWVLVAVYLLKTVVLCARIKTKQDLADYYGVTRKTLNKWIANFTSINLEQFKNSRKLTYYTLFCILSQLGCVDDQKIPLTKKRIKELCYTSDRVLRENISEKHCGVSLETYKKMNVFPPDVSTKILRHLAV